jgi:hypothetical protein
MTEEELVVFDILTRPAPELSTEERAEVKKVTSTNRSVPLCSNISMKAILRATRTSMQQSEAYI